MGLRKGHSERARTSRTAPPRDDVICDPCRTYPQPARRLLARTDASRHHSSRTPPTLLAKQQVVVPEWCASRLPAFLQEPRRSAPKWPCIGPKDRAPEALE